ARDTKRISDIRQIIIAMEMFHDDNNRFPDNTDGISSSGECIGDGVICGSSNAFEGTIRSYISSVPADPLHDCPDSSTGCGGGYYYYAYDYSHAGCEPVIAFHLFEHSGMRSQHGRRDTTSGGDMDIDDSEFVICLD
ncbi:unnamed protein product, partial [marine sediment metagenome]